MNNPAIYNQDALAALLLREGSKKKPSRMAIKKALDKAGIAYREGIDGVFTTHEAINAALMPDRYKTGLTAQESGIELL